MGKSNSIRAVDAAALIRVLGECRELGHNPKAWRSHLIAELSRLLDAEGGFTGEMAGCWSLDLEDLGAVEWWQDGCARSVQVDPELAEFARIPTNWPAQLAYHRRNSQEFGRCLTRKDLLDDYEWRSSIDYEWIKLHYGMDHRLWCFRPLEGRAKDEHLGIILGRAQGRPDFDERARSIITLAFEALVPLVGFRLARFNDPSPTDLSARVQQVLTCLLEGDSDKQIATRLEISDYTVNQHTKRIYRYFKVHSRTELLAFWISRCWQIPQCAF